MSTTKNAKPDSGIYSGAGDNWDKFWASVGKNGPVVEHAQHLGPCWVWNGRKVWNGYGIVQVGGFQVLAHRWSWELHRSAIPKGSLVLHKCDNRACVNPNHLFLGSHMDNTRDMIKKGRCRPPSGDRHYWKLHPEIVPKGETAPRAKLKTAQVLDIRARYADGRVTMRELAAEFAVHETTILLIVHRKRWKCLP